MPEINLKVVKEALSRRYHECNAGSHQKPNMDGMCDHCYRHLAYGTPKTDRILEERKGIPLKYQPFEAAWVNQQMMDEIDDQRETDWFNGMKRLREQMQAGHYRPSE